MAQARSHRQQPGPGKVKGPGQVAEHLMISIHDAANCRMPDILTTATRTSTVRLHPTQTCSRYP